MLRRLVVMEAFHYRYHPLARRMLDVVAGPGAGQVVPGPGAGQVVPGADAVAESGPAATAAWRRPPITRYRSLCEHTEVRGG